MSDAPATDVDWSKEKGIANEPTIRRFVASVGGRLVDEVHPKPSFENADFLFPDAKVVIELKILETEFGRTEEFEAKLMALAKNVAVKFGLGPFLRQEGEAGEAYRKGLLELFRPPLARITKKASRQIRGTCQALNLQDYKGLLWCVNDNFRELSPTTVTGLLGRILTGSGSALDGVVYMTNHYVELPGNPFANIVWKPLYRDEHDVQLSEFVDWLGRRWFDFSEIEQGPADSRIEGDHISLMGARAVTSARRHYRLSNQGDE